MLIIYAVFFQVGIIFISKHDLNDSLTLGYLKFAVVTLITAISFAGIIITIKFIVDDFFQSNDSCKSKNEK